MTPLELAQLFEKHTGSDWILDTAIKLPEKLLDKYYAPLQCKSCGAKKQHTVGNIKHMLLRNIYHCRCQPCRIQQKKKVISAGIISTIESTLIDYPTHTWILDRSKIDPALFYHSKVPVPLLCTVCKTTVYHSPSNIQTLKKRPDHIQCQECKNRNRLKIRFELKAKGEYRMDTDKTRLGFKITHTKCGHYHYYKSPFARARCPFCYPDKTVFSKLRDKEVMRLFVRQYTEEKVCYHDFDAQSKTLSLSCNLHPEAGIYPVGWNAFLRSKVNEGTFFCRSCHNQRLRRTTRDEYNCRISSKGLQIEHGERDVKIDTSAKMRHFCTKVTYHPPFYASPYEVEFKNKRCLYCYSSTCYQKNYDFVKNYIEMDEDRFLTHCGRKFRLLTTRAEFEGQIKRGRHIGSIKIRINELTCSRHNEYSVTWGNFFYRNAGCRKCSSESAVSYAHSYYQALLEYFELEYIPEFPIKIEGENTFRVDFKLPTLPNYVEIDSIIHVRGWNRSDIGNYKLRDKKKDIILKGNLERIKMYDSDHQILSLREQLETIETAFLNRVIRNGLLITAADIEIAKEDSRFFHSYGITAMNKKMMLYHKGHIEFKEANHVRRLLLEKGDDCEFLCTIHQQTFKRHPRSVLKIHFLCPICAEKIFNGTYNQYFLHPEKIGIISSHVTNRFKGRLSFDEIGPQLNAYFYRTVVFPVNDKRHRSTLYMSLRDLVSLPPSKVLSNIKRGEYKQYRIARQRRLQPYVKQRQRPTIEIENIDKTKRLKLHVKCHAAFRKYQKQAKLINKMMKKPTANKVIYELIKGNQTIIDKYYHKMEREARRAVNTYDSEILPFFAAQHNFELHTSRQQYVNAQQFLLIRDVRCGHYFYLTWNWLGIKVKAGLSPIQCQQAVCYAAFYRNRNPGRKIEQQNLLRYFKDMYHGQFYPVHPNVKIMVRDPIPIIHLPTKTLLTASIDNFRRGKFQSEYKTFTRKDLIRNFPEWVINS